MHRVAKAFSGLVVGWLALMINHALTATAWGGPFTVLITPVVMVVVSAVYVAVAMVIGFLLWLPGIRDWWVRAGRRVILMILPPVLLLAFSKPLGLRTVDPETGYSMMDSWWEPVCYLMIVFPFVNLPKRVKALFAFDEE